MNRKDRLELNRIAPCFQGYRNVMRYMQEGERMYVWCGEEGEWERMYVAQYVHGTWGNVTEIR